VARNDDVHVEGIFLVVTVQCLACESTYAKPAGRGTVRNNPGCPHCGYLGWAQSETGATKDSALSRSGAGPPQDPLARSH
jgi:hypothetical protein